MACILLVDGSEVARRALHGILVRGGHRLASVSTVEEAWTFVRQHVRVDLVVTDLRLPGGSGLELIQRLKGDTFLKLLPVVIYTSHSDREAIKLALALKVQNILVKPYHDDAIYAEIAKAAVNPWRSRHFEEEKSFCRQMGYQAEELHGLLAGLRTRLGEERVALAGQAEARNLGSIRQSLRALSTQAETAGAWGVVDYLAELERFAEQPDWPGFQTKLAEGGVADWLIDRHLDPATLPEPFLSGQELNARQEGQARAKWFDAPGEGRCPVTDFHALQVELDALPGCPVLDSAAAAFVMNATGQPSSLNPLMDLVARDTGLTAQMLISASELKRREDFDPTPLEDPRLAVGRLGEVRLAALARNLVTVAERHWHLPPHFSWSQYWTFQMGVARVARFTCHYLELYSLELQARMGGLLHDFGQLLLLKLHPHAFQAALAYAREHRVPLAEAEKLFLGCTTHDLAGYFGEKRNLPAPYVSVMRWVDRPAEAPEHRQLVAIVSLARDLCRQNGIGFSGDAQWNAVLPLEETPEWEVLRSSVFPSFDLRKFEEQVRSDCRSLSQELQGQNKAPAMA